LMSRSGSSLDMAAAAGTHFRQTPVEGHTP